VSAGYQVEARGDAGLIKAVRAGSESAYSELSDRHRYAAEALGRCVAEPAEVSQAVSEAFAAVLQSLRSGDGPDEAFRFHVLSLVLIHLGALPTPPPGAGGARPVDEPAAVDPLLSQAFELLPERWQAVLWHAAVEELPPAEVGTLLGISPQAVAPLVRRAREGLRQVYLDCCLADAAHQSCAHLAGWVDRRARRSLPGRESAEVDKHLGECPACTELYLGLLDLDGPLADLLGPVVLGPLAGRYLTQLPKQTAEVRPATVTVARRWWPVLAGVAAVVLVVVTPYLRSGDWRAPAPRASGPVVAGGGPGAVEPVTGPATTPTSTQTRRTSTTTVRPRPPTATKSSTSRRPPTSSTTSTSVTRPPPGGSVGLSLDTVQDEVKTTVTFTVSNNTGATAPVSLLLTGDPALEITPLVDGCELVDTTERGISLDCGSLSDGSSRSGGVMVFSTGDCPQTNVVQGRAVVGAVTKRASKDFQISCD
jgi:hypothetical protein